MKKYGTLLIGCGYFSVGYALAAGDCLMVEEHQSADVGFYLPMRSFRYSGGEPRTEEGRLPCPYAPHYRAAMNLRKAEYGISRWGIPFFCI